MAKKKRAKKKASVKKAAKRKASKEAEKKGKSGGKGGKKKGSKKRGLEPRAVTTGKGASPAEVGAAVVGLVRAGTPEEEIWGAWFHPKFVSIEGGQMCQAWEGKKAVGAKAAWWYSNHRVHSVEVEGPYVGATGFGVKYTIDAEEIASGKRWRGDELAFYTVKNGKVVQEEFMGMAMPEGEAAAG